jgi:hypothetical protein
MTKTVKKTSEEAYAYTPGLKVKKKCIVTKTRRLPLPGEVLVKESDTVDFETNVARTKIPGDPVILRVGELLGITNDDIPNFMLKKIGDTAKKDECLAKYTPFFGLIKKEVKAPIDCTVENISTTTGQVILRGAPMPVDVNSYIPGKIVEVLPKEGVVIETEAALIQGIFGIGGEQHGELFTVVDSPQEALDGGKIKSEHRGKILIGGKLATLDAMKKAAEVGVKGLVVGGLRSVDITAFLGYEIGVAITGEENIPLSIIATEGFGEMSMSERTFNLLKSFDGKMAAINGTTQIRAGVLRPEIIIPYKSTETTDESSIDLQKGMKVGTPIRIIAPPYFGEIGVVSSLPVDLVKVDSGSLVRVVEIELGEGKVIVPRANVEIIEE